MNYKDLINFEPITEVVKFSKTNQADYQKALVKTFVFSKAYEESHIPRIVKNLDFARKGESFGLQIVGNYGTGKSHLMSLVSLIGEDENLLSLLEAGEPKEHLSIIAGKFRVLRFELGNKESLWEVVTYKIEEYLKQLGINFSFEDKKPKSYYEMIQLMMAEFEAKFPDRGFLIVVDEMLAYLKGRSTADKLNSDLQVLQALGQACDGSRFKFMFGVQELIYQSPEFQFAAKMLQQVNDRYKDVIITKEDVAYVVKNRLLQKNEHQKQKVKDHLDPFLKYFSDMHARSQDYVDLFPVHPTYFENFERIRIGKSQREVLKTLSQQFEDILDDKVPSDNPGLLTYDRYWQDIQKEQDLLAIPDVRKIKEITDTINDKIESYFSGARANKKPVAKRISNACAIKVLQQELNRQNGTNAEELVDDLCLMDALADDREFLIDIIDSAAEQIIKATSGQYFDKNPDNGEYHLRIEGGINFDQKIKDYADTMSDSQKDEYFFTFLEKNLPLDHDTYRTGFKIWAHDIEWKSHKTFCEGYIFFGNPHAKSTTHPRQHFYIYFMPIFNTADRNMGNEQDELYFDMLELSKEFKDAVVLYGSAQALQARADSSQKAIYRQKIDELNKKARALFEEDYVRVTKVIYQGKDLPLNGYQLPGLGATKEQIFSEVASQVFDDWFEEERPNYPKFTQLKEPLAKENYHRMIKQGLLKIANPDQANRDGEGMLNGLGLWVPGMLDYSHSPYAKSLVKQLKDKGEGQVLNRDEILECLHPETNLWITKDFGIEAGLEFLVMTTLAALGELEVALSSGNTINSTNLDNLRDVDTEDYFAFNHVKEPKGLNEAALKAMFLGLLGRDLSKQLKDPNTYTQLVKAAEECAKRTVTALSKIQGGLTRNGIEIIDSNQASEYRRKFTAFSGFCDKLAQYTSEAKIKNFPYTTEQVKQLLESKPLVEKVENLLGQIEDLEKDIQYLQQARQYLPEGALKDEVSDVIGRFATVIAAGDDTKVASYAKELEKLKNQYAEWYLREYLKYRISDSDHTQKEALLNSDEKQVCDKLQLADFLSTAQYQNLLSKINKLQPADSAVNKELILTAPYQDFNPLDYEDGEQLSVKKLKNELLELLENWEQTLKDTLEDPMVQKNMELLDKPSVELLKDFKVGKTALTQNNASDIQKAMQSLHEGLEKVELSLESLKSSFNKPLNPDEAIEAFKEYVGKVSAGKERNKIRIILK